MIIGKYTLIRFLKKPIPLICACVIPVVMMFIPALWEWENMGGLGLLAFVVMGSGFITSQTILTDRLDGTITRIMTAPVTMTRYLAENLVACALPIWIQLVLVTGVGMVFYDWSLSFALPLTYLWRICLFGSGLGLYVVWVYEEQGQQYRRVIPFSDGNGHVWWDVVSTGSVSPVGGMGRAGVPCVLVGTRV